MTAQLRSSAHSLPVVPPWVLCEFLHSDNVIIGCPPAPLRLAEPSLHWISIYDLITDVAASAHQHIVGSAYGVIDDSFCAESMVFGGCASISLFKNHPSCRMRCRNSPHPTATNRVRLHQIASLIGLPPSRRFSAATAIPALAKSYGLSDMTIQMTTSDGY